MRNDWDACAILVCIAIFAIAVFVSIYSIQNLVCVVVANEIDSIKLTPEANDFTTDK